MKIHLKFSTTDRLSLCGIQPDRWVLLGSIKDQVPDNTCKTCGLYAQQADPTARTAMDRYAAAHGC